MATVYCEVDVQYQIQDSTKTLSINAELFDGQGGAYAFFLNETFKAVNKKTNLGKGATIKGGVVTVSSTVKDKLEETNWTSIDITLYEGDTETKTYSYSKEAEKHLDTVQYIIKINLI
jgi:molybdopterin synthase catalytic subunit